MGVCTGSSTCAAAAAGVLGGAGSEAAVAAGTWTQVPVSMCYSMLGDPAGTPGLGCSAHRASTVD